ncbi:MAG: AbrB/MazE/SpoVT family DNA-binding domain-containing protein [Coleofasciculus sp.]|uniref:AbrB/MazE/SpoVT family DNA-binding domain-containing protein n=1 Tax=Coleofasciculus sp. TaxID=3100458 RepID=UPI003A1C00AC
MNTEYRVKLIQQGNTQTLPIPPELNLDAKDVTIRQENGKLIVEPYQKKSLLEVFSTLEPLDEEFPDIDAGLLPLDDIEV